MPTPRVSYFFQFNAFSTLFKGQACPFFITIKFIFDQINLHFQQLIFYVHLFFACHHQLI